MSPTTFHRFQEFSFELRSRIWEYATALHIQDLAKRLPPRKISSLPPWFENLWDTAPPYAPVRKSALRVCIRDPYDGQKRRYEEDGFETLVDCLSLSAVCHEARVCVAKFCQPLVPDVYCEYDLSPFSLKAPKDDTPPIVIRNLHCQPEAEALKYFSPRPTTLTIKMWGYKSAEHFVEEVFQFFGNRIQRLVLVEVVQYTNDMKSAYWSDSSPRSYTDEIKVILKRYPEGDPTLMSITRNGEIYISERLQQIGGWLPSRLALNLLKINQIFNVSLERLPHLEHIEVNLDVQGWESVKSRIVMMYRKDIGVLAVTSSDTLPWPSRTPSVCAISTPPSPNLYL